MTLSYRSTAMLAAACLLASFAITSRSLQAQADPAGKPNAPAGRGTADGRGARGPRYVDAEPINFADHTGWQSLFDGVSMKGWDCPPDVWHAENGEIVAVSSATDPAGSTYCIWKGGEPANFEFQTELKAEGQGANSGIQFRAVLLGAVPTAKHSAWDTFGYQADWDYQNSNTGALIECCTSGARVGTPPRPDRAYRGQVVRTAVGEGQKPSLLSTFGDPDQLKSYIDAPGWNQLHLIARGNTMMFMINGHLMSVLVDDNAAKAKARGLLAVQMEGRGDIKVHFRNLWLKNLP